MTKAKEIETAFYEREATGMCLDDCFKQTAEQFGISIDDVVDALNDAAFEEV